MIYLLIKYFVMTHSSELVRKSQGAFSMFVLCANFGRGLGNAVQLSLVGTLI